jgi:hypothetical protein
MGETTNVAEHCWKRIAFILGHALLGLSSILSEEDLSSDIKEKVKGLLGDALEPCSEDEKFLANGKAIRKEVFELIRESLDHWRYDRPSELTKDLIDNYKEAINEVKKIKSALERGEKGIWVPGTIYALGLALIISDAMRFGRTVDEGDADEVLHMMTQVIPFIDSLVVGSLILWALRPLRELAPHRYLMLLAGIAGTETMSVENRMVTIRFLFDELRGLLDQYNAQFGKQVWPFVFAVKAYSELIMGHAQYLEGIGIDIDEVVKEISKILTKLGQSSKNLYTLARTYVLLSALVALVYARTAAIGTEPYTKIVKSLKSEFGIGKIIKESEGVLNELNSMMNKVDVLMRDNYLMDFVKAVHIGNVGSEEVKSVILDLKSQLEYHLAFNYFINDELDRAEESFDEVVKIKSELNLSQVDEMQKALVTKAIKSLSLSNINDFIERYKQLLNLAEKEEHPLRSQILSQYLILLALSNNVEEVRKLLEENWDEFSEVKPNSILTKLMLKALLKPILKPEDELIKKLEVEYKDLLNAFKDYVSIHDLFENMAAIISGIISGDVGEIENAKTYTIIHYQNGFKKLLKRKRGLINKIEGIGSKITEYSIHDHIDRLNDVFIVQLITMDPIARFAHMLFALVNWNNDLAMVHALLGGVVRYILWMWDEESILEGIPKDVRVVLPPNLFIRMFLTAYGKCCDLSNNDFRLALAKLYLSLHVTPKLKP